MLKDWFVETTTERILGVRLKWWQRAIFLSILKTEVKPRRGRRAEIIQDVWTDEELAEINRMLDENSIPTGINVNDLL